MSISHEHERTTKTIRRLTYEHDGSGRYSFGTLTLDDLLSENDGFEDFALDVWDMVAVRGCVYDDSDPRNITVIYFPGEEATEATADYLLPATEDTTTGEDSLIITMPDGSRVRLTPRETETGERSIEATFMQPVA